MACNEEVIDEIISASQGDLRKAITLLQSTSHLKGSEEVTAQDVIEIAGVSPMTTRLLYSMHVYRWCHTPSLRHYFQLVP